MQKQNKLIIATYNIQLVLNPEKIVENITQMAAGGVSLFCLQEVVNVPNQTFIIDKILKHLGPNWKAAYHVGKEQSRLSIGNAIVWNKEILTLKWEEKILLPKQEKFDLHEHFFYKVVGVPAVPLQRKAITCFFTFAKNDIRVTSVHVDNTGGPIHRMRQVAYLRERLHNLEASKHEIICGDFNTFDLLKIGYEKKLLQKKLGSEYIDASEHIDWTADIQRMDLRTSIKVFPWLIKTFNIHVRRRLDYIWVKNFVVEECNKSEMSGSDHFPVIAKLEIF